VEGRNRVDEGDLTAQLLKDKATDPRVAGSPEMELRWKAATELTRQQQHIKELEAENVRLRDVVEAAGEYLYDTSKRQALQDAYTALAAVADG